MKVYKLGDPSKPTIMLFSGTCCYWKTNFGHVFENLQKYFYVMVVSYSGFDETENTTFISELDEVRKVEHYIQSELHGQLFAAYVVELIFYLSQRSQLKISFVPIFIRKLVNRFMLTGRPFMSFMLRRWEINI